MTTSELQANQLIVLRNGNVGLTASFNNKVAWLIFKSYINPISKYEDNLTHKNCDDGYDIVAVHDGSSIEEVDKIFSRKVNLEDYPLVWHE